MCPLPLLFMRATFVKFTVAGHSLPPEKKKIALSPLLPPNLVPVVLGGSKTLVVRLNVL